MTDKKPLKYFFPWTPSAFKEKTIHLTYIQRGLYRDLIDYYMETKKALPDNDIALANICRIELSTWLQYSVEVRAMFMKIKDNKGLGLLQQKTCEENLAFQAAWRDKCSRNGKKGGRGKSLKDNGNKPLANPTPKLKDIGYKKEDTVVVSACAENDTHALSQAIGEITGWNNNPNWFGDYQRLGAWIASGWNSNLDILPTIRKLMAKRKDDPPTTLKYFEKAIADSHASRLQPVPKGNPNEKYQRTDSKSLGKSERAKSAILEGLGLNAEE